MAVLGRDRQGCGACQRSSTRRSRVPHPATDRGRRHPLVAILGLAAAAVLAGARSIAAIAEWAADTPQHVRAAVGARRDAPDHFAVPAEATIRRTLSRLEPDALADRDRDPGPAGAGRRRAVAVDGKTLRGAHPPDGDGRPVHLLAAMDHTSRAVLAQGQVGGAPEEVRAFGPLLDGLDLADVVVTTDALQTHPEAAEFQSPASGPTTCSRSRPTNPPCWTAAASALAPRPGAGPHPRPRPRAHRGPHPQGRLGPPFRVPPRRPSPPSHPHHPRPAPPSPAVHDRDGLRHHQPHPRPGQPRPARRPHPGALGDRSAAPHPRHHLRRGRLPSPHRRRPKA
jgi:DDE_Tnp_1-associated